MMRKGTSRPSRMWPQAQAPAAGRNLTSAQLVIVLSIAVALGSATLAGCGGGSSSPIVIAATSTPTAAVTPTPTSTPTATATPTATSTPTATTTPTATLTPVVAAGSSAVAVNCQTQRAWIAMNNTGGAGNNGTVAEVDLTKNPATTNPVIGTIDLDADIPSGVALTPTQLLVVAGDVGLGGHLYIFNQSDNSPVPGSPFDFPAGSDTFGISAVVYDLVHNQAVVSTCDAIDCTGNADPATGWVIFDLTTNKFGPVISAPEPDSLSLNSNTGLIVAPADAIDPPSPTNAILAGNATQACLLSDLNLTEDGGDPDGSWADPSTNLLAVGDFFVPVVTVLNLNKATFTGTAPSCSLNEAETNPNSVDADVFAATNDPADVVAINPVTHQVLVASSLGPDVGLIDLPNAPVPQLAGPLKFVASTLPLQPDSNSFSAIGEPFSTTIDTCQNKGLVANSDFTFLARIDLMTLHDHPANISTSLPKGTCFGGFTLSCDNGNGVTFFPLPVVPVSPVSAARRLKHRTRSQMLRNPD